MFVDHVSSKYSRNIDLNVTLIPVIRLLPAILPEALSSLQKMVLFQVTGTHLVLLLPYFSLSFCPLLIRNVFWSLPL
jgi:hypothetical protein